MDLPTYIVENAFRLELNHCLVHTQRFTKNNRELLIHRIKSLIVILGSIITNASGYWQDTGEENLFEVTKPLYSCPSSSVVSTERQFCVFSAKSPARPQRRLSVMIISNNREVGQNRNRT